MFAVAALAAGSAAGSSPRLVVTPLSPIAGAKATIELRASVNPPVYASVRSPNGAASKVRLRQVRTAVWRATFTFRYSGGWTVRARGVSTEVFVRSALAEPPPASSFVPLGAPGCTPPSPAKATGEARGSATIGDLWAVGFGPNLADSRAVVLVGVVGKQFKILWRVVGSGDAMFTAIAPDGTRHPPTQLVRHADSNWNRPGDEWGSLFFFSQPGCWQIHVDRGDNTGDLWLLVNS